MLDRVLDLIAAGGSVMPPLLILSGVLWFGLCYRFLILRRGDSRSIRLLMKDDESFAANTPFLEFVSRIKTLPAHERSSLSGDVVLLDAKSEFFRFQSLTTVVVVISPLLGLLGTVSGMIETFAGLGDMALFNQTGGIAGGISQALVSTQMGLSVAIPGLVLGRILAKREKVLQTELRQATQMACVPESNNYQEANP